MLRLNGSASAVAAAGELLEQLKKDNADLSADNERLLNYVESLESTEMGGLTSGEWEHFLLPDLAGPHYLSPAGDPLVMVYGCSLMPSSRSDVLLTWQEHPVAIGSCWRTLCSSRWITSYCPRRMPGSVLSWRRCSTRAAASPPSLCLVSPLSRRSLTLSLLACDAGHASSSPGSVVESSSCSSSRRASVPAARPQRRLPAALQPWQGLETTQRCVGGDVRLPAQCGWRLGRRWTGSCGCCWRSCRSATRR